MEEIRARIKELIDETGLSNKEFAEKIDINPAIVSHILSGRNNPSLQVIQRITNVYTNVNSDYLLSGNGTLFKSESTKESGPVEQGINQSPFNTQEGVRAVAPPGSTPLLRPKAQSEIPDTAPEEKETTQEKASVKTNVNTRENTNVNQAERHIERVIIFYSDKSMEEYQP